jgi:putative ABC transport system permease protein
VHVVGIVADERHNGVTGAVKEKFYIPHSQWHVVTGGNLIRNAFVVVRAAGDPMALADPVRREIRALDGNLPVASVRTLSDVVSTAVGTQRLTGFLLGSFAAIALALAAVGIYGVLAYAVSQRTHEIGVRLALGADEHVVLRMVLRQGLTLALLGVALGLGAAAGLSRLMGSLLYQVHPTDPLTFGGVSVLLMLVAALASAVPAWRASRVSPLVALRTE